MTQMKEQIKTPEKELSNKEIASLFDTQFKILLIRILSEMIELSHKIKATQSEIKDNTQRTKSERKEMD